MIPFPVFFCWISNEHFFLEDFLMSMTKTFEKCVGETTPDSKLETKKFDSPIQVLAAALISSLSFVGLGLAGAKYENQRKSRLEDWKISCRGFHLKLGGGNSKIFYFTNTWE